MPTIKLVASQAKCTKQYKNLRVKVLKCCVNIYFNRQCMKRDIISKYARVKIPYASPAAKVTQKKAQLTRLREEIKYLYGKKDLLNQSLYKVHLQTASEWGRSWELIRDNIHNTVNPQFEKKFKSIESKLTKLTTAQKTKVEDTATFYPRFVNSTDITFTNEELDLLNKGIKYNLNYKHKMWVNNLALEVESAITLLPPGEQNYMRHQVAKNINKLINQQNPNNRRTAIKGKEEFRILKQIRSKIQTNNALITKQIKGTH